MLLQHASVLPESLCHLSDLGAERYDLLAAQCTNVTDSIFIDERPSEWVADYAFASDGGGNLTDWEWLERYGPDRLLFLCEIRGHIDAFIEMSLEEGLCPRCVPVECELGRDSESETNPNGRIMNTNSGDESGGVWRVGCNSCDYTVADGDY